MTNRILPDRSHAVARAERRNAVRLGHAWVAAFNERDAAAIVALCAADVRVTPTVLTGHRTFRGHDGVRTWMREHLERERAGSASCPRVRVARVRVVPPSTVLVAGDVCIDGTPAAPFAMLLTVREDLVAEAHAYLSEDGLLEQLHYVPVAAGAVAPAGPEPDARGTETTDRA